MKKLLALFTCMILLLSMSVPAMAANTAVDWDKTGSIHITLKNSGEPHQVLHGAVFQLFRVGTAISVEGTLRFRLTDDFAASNISLDDLRAEGLAEHLAAYAQQKGVTGISASADANGCVRFDALQLGLYLVVQSGSVSGYYNTLPFLISLPMGDADGTGWVYDVEASPKAEETPNIPSGNKTSLTVQKYWNTPDDMIPKKITVVLLRNGKIYDTQELSASNRWTYKWTQLDADYRWSVSEIDIPDHFLVSYSLTGSKITITNTYTPTIPENPDSLTVCKKWDTGGRAHPDSVKVELWNGSELYAVATLSDSNNWSVTWTQLPQSNHWAVYEVDIPEQYEVTYSVDGTTITILNTDKSNPPEPVPPPTTPNTPTTPEGPTLIQTGQLNWPIPVLAAIGTCLFLIGWVSVKRKGRNHNEK